MDKLNQEDVLNQQYRESIESLRQDIVRCEIKIKANLDLIEHYICLLCYNDYYKCSCCNRFFKQNKICIHKDGKHHLCFNCY